LAVHWLYAFVCGVYPKSFVAWNVCLADIVWNCAGMAVPILSTSYFWGATTSTIMLNNNAVTSVASTSFSNLARLTFVSLARNHLVRITVDGLRGMASVEQLTLSGNNITYIEPLAFSNMTSLVTLKINNNLVTRIEATTLVGLDRLELFSAAFNRITLIEPTTFDSMSMLTRLVLDGNSIVHVVAPDPGSGRLWRALGPTLTSCRLSSNNITLINIDTFASAVMLGDLELSFNHITLIQVRYCWCLQSRLCRNLRVPNSLEVMTSTADYVFFIIHFYLSHTCCECASTSVDSRFR
jgi:hypothetical protein